MSQCIVYSSVYISVWRLLPSFLSHFLYRAVYWKGHSCAGQYIATLLYAALDPRAMLHLSFNSVVSIYSVHIGVASFVIGSSFYTSQTEQHFGITTNLHSIFNNSCLQFILNYYRYAALDPRALVASLTLTVSNAQNSIIHCIEYSNAKQQRYYHYLSWRITAWSL